MLKRFVTQGDNFPFSVINPSIIGEKVVVRSRLNESTDLAGLITVSTYETTTELDEDGTLFYYFNGDDSLLFREEDVFTPFYPTQESRKWLGFDPEYKYFVETIKVGNAGVDLVGNNVTFPKYKNQHGLVRNVPITGKVIVVSRDKDSYSIVLDQEGMDAKVIVRVTAEDEVIL